MAYKQEYEGGRQLDDYDQAVTNTAPAGPVGAQKQIADYWKTATGQDATREQYSQWGNNIDANYMQKIQGAISGTDAAKAWATRDTTPPPPTTQSEPQPQPTSGGGGPAPLANAAASGAASSPWQVMMQRYTEQEKANAAADAERMARQEAQKQEVIGTYMSRIKQPLQIGHDDANIRTQADPYNANVERQKRDYLANTAEKAGALANMQGETRVANEKAGQAKGLFEANLVGRELQSRRDEIQNALQSLAGMLNADQQRDLTKELGMIDAQLRAAGMESNERLGMAQIGSNQGIANGQLGFNYTQLESNANRDALRTALGL